MDRIWSPWRCKYISKCDEAPNCVFCDNPRGDDDPANLILHRGDHNFVILNLYPYTSGHLMVVPYAHIGTLAEADDEVAVEMMLLTRRMQRALAAVYRAPGFNVGMNIGACAGAGIAGHIHMHVLPRWAGDANFMSTVGETRILPEDLHETYRRMSEALVDIV